ncbi:MAG: tRNA 4-thiouridine(8) synthase ThiI [Spirochaetaceae bacterium]|jgi:thiamine biosynthesis protein ThiI|nr:tRNA 4-thiouridine(8) synthase ThiI [Spirochaetaceae bacterium]
MKVFLLKPGEITLKAGNKAFFEKVLCHNLAAMLKGSGARITRQDGRFFVRCEEPARVEAALPRLAGITGWAQAAVTEKTMEAILDAAVSEAKKAAAAGHTSFKVEARRADKSFPLTSHDINRAAGEAVLEALPALKVNVREPGFTLRIEIRDKAYVYGAEKRGIRGLPSGTAGRGLLLLSGGIDSPVAGFMMAARGMSLAALYFHAYPYTSDEAKEKVITLAAILREYTINLKLYVLSVTEIQRRIKEGAPEEWATVLLRMAMMEAATVLARYDKCKCIITGESLAQVASQTIDNITCTESRAGLPVLRPLIGMDKEDITKKAIDIGTYQTSILPHNDCCSLFSPVHPILHGSLEEASAIYSALNLTPLIEEALNTRETHKGRAEQMA